MNILEDGSGSEDESVNSVQGDFTINEHYAKAFTYKKEREELSRCEHLAPGFLSFILLV